MVNKTVNAKQVTAAITFKHQLEGYKRAIDTDIAQYSAHIREATKQQYGEYGGLVTEAFLDLLGRGGKRIRGALVMAGYELCGGQDRQMIVRAATALEIIHAHFLVLDDIQDRSVLRRGRPTVHEMLAAEHHRRGWSGDAAHTGMSLALNAAFGGNAAAQMLLCGLQVEDRLKINALAIVNLTITTTAHGQTQDIANEVIPEVGQADINHAMEWKTANYTLLNPLCVGMVLAGAGCEDTDAIRGYALPAGLAFQITDDIVSTFGRLDETGKSNMDDIREGKQTLLTVHALKHASASDATFLRRCLGNGDLIETEFARCQQIITASGARTTAEAQAQAYIDQALTMLDAAPASWAADRVTFLRELAKYLVTRVG